MRKRKEKLIKIQPIQLQIELEKLFRLTEQIAESPEACSARMAAENLFDKWNGFLELLPSKILEILENNTTRGHRLDVGRICRDSFEKVAQEVMELINKQPIKTRLQIGRAAKVIPMEVETCPGCAKEIEFDDEGLYVEEFDKNLCSQCGNDYQRSQAEDLTHF